MYERKEINKKFLSTGLLRIAYGIDAAYGDGNVVRETFVQCSAALERSGEDLHSILRDREAGSWLTARIIMDDVDNTDVDWSSGCDFFLLLLGLVEMLDMQFADDHEARTVFLFDLFSTVKSHQS